MAAGTVSLMHAERMERARRAMLDHGVDVLLLSVGADLPYLTGYEAMPLERLTMLVLPREGDAELIVPRLEAPRVVERPGVFSIVAWNETDDPISLVTERLAPELNIAIGNQTWAQFLVELNERMPGSWWRLASDVLGPVRSVKVGAEIEALARASAAADRVAVQLHAGEIPLIGRTEAQVSADIGRRLLAEGHHKVNFAIVAAGENAASPHHEAGERVIQPNEVVLCDFGGTMLTDGGAGYCSDITRCVYTGEPPAEFVELYDVLFAAQAAGVAAATEGTTCEFVDLAARRPIVDAGYGQYFIHRTGHGIGIEAHEDPYIVEGNTAPLEVGHAFSVEPGIYIPGTWGARLEDIVVCAPEAPRPLNEVDHHLVVVEA
jgi:Xaa-Pro aminopeptidase